MESLRRFYAILLADWLERCRSPRFRTILVMTAVLTWICFPPLTADYIVLGINGHHRGDYSSAWIGTVLAMLSIWVSLIGFYIVRGTLRRDIDSRVWQLLEITPLSRPAYLLAKWASHVAVFATIVLVQLGVGLLVQLVRAEDTHIDLIALFTPVAMLSLPSLALTAMFAVVFDMVPWLRRTAGNILYFALWLVMLIAAVNMVDDADTAAGQGLGDARGIVEFNRVVHARLAPELGPKMRICLGCGLAGARAERFAWPAWPVSGAQLTSRAFWLGLAALGTLLCAPWMDRAAATAAGEDRSGEGAGRGVRWLGIVLRPLQGGPFGTMLAAELLLMLRQRSLWWWAGLAVAGAVQAFAPASLAALAVIAAWMLSIDVFGRAALVEIDSGSGAVIFAAPHASWRVLCARWIGLLALAWLSVLPAVLRFAMQTPMSALAALAVGASLVTCALVLGAFARSAHPTELLVCVLAYLGLNGASVANVAAAPQLTLQLHLVILPLLALLLPLAWIRLHQLAAPAFLRRART